MEKKIKNIKKIQSAETKNKLYESANQLFRKYGFENVSVDSIVEMAGVSKGAFYVHFESKDALIAALINDYVKEVDLDYKSFLETLKLKSASDILITMVDKITDTLIDYIGYEHMKTLYKVQITKALNNNAVMAYNRKLYKMFNDILTKGVQQGEFKSDVPADILTRHFIIAFRGLTYEWCVRYPDFDLKAQALQHFEIMLSGIKKG